MIVWCSIPTTFDIIEAILVSALGEVERLMLFKGSPKAAAAILESRPPLKKIWGLVHTCLYRRLDSCKAVAILAPQSRGLTDLSWIYLLCLHLLTVARGAVDRIAFSPASKQCVL